jgi:hypothetical protein
LRDQHEVWFVRSDGSNVEEEVEDARRSAIEWISLYSDRKDEVTSRDESSYTIAQEMIDDYGPTKAEDYAGSSSRAHASIGATRAPHRDSARQDV